MVEIVRVEYILSAVHEHDDSRELLANRGINFPSLASGFFWLFLIQIAVINSPGVLPHSPVRLVPVDSHRRFAVLFSSYGESRGNGRMQIMSLCRQVQRESIVRSVMQRLY